MTMQETMINQELASLDLAKVAALQQKRTLAFVNHFVTTTVQFLNGFMKNCEQKLMDFERKLEKVEASMVLLEARLSSIPEVNTMQPEMKTEVKSDASTKEPEQISNTETTSVQVESLQELPETKESPVESHPEYERFVKMVHVGVPLQAVKLKVSLEGLDPGVLETMLGK